MNGGPVYSTQAILTMALLKRGENDVDIFVEDSAHPTAWIALVRRALKSDVRISSVHPAGGRAAVIEACRVDQLPRARRRLYIIDRDLDDLTATDCPKLRHLYRLEKSCFENLLLGERTFVDIATACCVVKSETQIYDECQFEQWYESNLSKLRSLFVVFGAMMRLGSGRRAASIGYSGLTIHPGSSVLDDTKILRLIRHLVRALIDDFGFPTSINEIKSVKVRSKQVHADSFISGKHFLFPIFANYFRGKFPFRGTNNELIVHLARGFSRELDKGLFRRLRRL